MYVRVLRFLVAQLWACRDGYVHATRSTFATFNFQLIPIVHTDEIYCAGRFGCNEHLKCTIGRKFFSSMELKDSIEK